MMLWTVFAPTSLLAIQVNKMAKGAWIATVLNLGSPMEVSVVSIPADRTVGGRTICWNDPRPTKTPISQRGNNYD